MRTKLTLAFASLVLLVVVTASGAQSPDKTYGAEFTIDEVTPLADIIASPTSFTGKEVRTQGYVYTMCDDSGCWLGVLPRLDSTDMVKISFVQTDIRFPIGKETTAHAVEFQGTIISAEQEADEHAAHMVEEGEDPAAHAEEEAEHDAPQTRTIYVCPRHPEVMTAAPASCPLAGAELVAKQVPLPEFTVVAINGISAVVRPAK
jgi:hypothetical protein